MDKNYGISNIEHISRLCYFVGLGIGFIGVFGIAVVIIFHIPILEMIPICSFYAVTGYYCPGCGGTRAVRALLHGEIIKSLYYHPFVIYLFVYYIVYEISHLLNIISHGKIRGFRLCPRYFYIGIAIIITQCMVKNYLKLQYGFVL